MHTKHQKKVNIEMTKKSVMGILVSDLPKLEGGKGKWDGIKAWYARQTVLNHLDALEVSKPSVHAVMAGILNKPEFRQVEFWLQYDRIILRRIENEIRDQTTVIRIAALTSTRERALTVYRAICKMGNEIDEVGPGLKYQIEEAKDALELAAHAERAATEQYANAILHAERVLAHHYFDVYGGELPEELGNDPDIRSAVSYLREDDESDSERAATK